MNYQIQGLSISCGGDPGAGLRVCVLPQVVVNARFALDVITSKAYIERRHQERWFPKEPSSNLEVERKPTFKVP